MSMKVQNLPADVDKYGWVVARFVDDELWFYGGWSIDREAEADEQARQIGGIVLEVEG